MRLQRPYDRSCDDDSSPWHGANDVGRITYRNQNRIEVIVVIAFAHSRAVHSCKALGAIFGNDLDILIRVCQSPRLREILCRISTNEHSTRVIRECQLRLVERLQKLAGSNSSRLTRKINALDLSSILFSVLHRW